MISKTTRDKIVAQAQLEINFARKHKQGKVTTWQKNENQYYAVKTKSDDSRANVELARMQEFVNTLLSKIDAALKFTFTKRKDAQRQRVDRLNSLREFDANRDNWDLKDLVGKKQCILYGRAIYAYSADSHMGYTPHLDNVDVYDFLVDPSGGGIDLENAMFMGRYGVVKTKKDLQDNKKMYIASEVNDLLRGDGNSGETTQEETNKENRTSLQRVGDSDKEIGDPQKYKFWEWYTTYEGERYYLLLCEQGSKAIKVEKLKDVFANDMWPFWTYAAFMDLTEFWTPSHADYVREIFMAQSVNINQMLDNAEQINKPQKIVDVTALENLADVKYKRGGGVIRTKGGVDAQKAIQFVQTPSINTPIQVFDVLEAIQEKALGVTAGDKGVADPDGKATIYEGNQANTANRYGLLNKSYAFGYRRFSALYENGAREHLVKAVAVDILGPDGVDVVMIKGSDIFKKNDKFGIIVEATDAEAQLDLAKKRQKNNFLQAQIQNPAINQTKLTEMSGLIAGFSDEQMRELLDVSDFGDAKLMSDAERDIERILEGEDFLPNMRANAAYKQRFVDYFIDHEEDFKPETFSRFTQYIESLNPIIIANTVRDLESEQLKVQAEQMALATDPNGMVRGGDNPLDGGNGSAPRPRRQIEETPREITSNNINGNG